MPPAARRATAPAPAAQRLRSPMPQTLRGGLAFRAPPPDRAGLPRTGEAGYRVLFGGISTWTSRCVSGETHMSDTMQQGIMDELGDSGLKEIAGILGTDEQAAKPAVEGGLFVGSEDPGDLLEPGV